MNESQPARSGLKDFALIVVALAILRMVLPFIPVPKSVAWLGDFVLMAGVFLATVYAIYRAMSAELNPKQAALFFVAGVALHVIGAVVAIYAFNRVGPGSILFLTLGQSGLMVWCVGLGALIASLLREKNIIIPVALFLIAFDIFLVLAPQGFTQKMMKANPQVLQNMGMAIPEVAQKAQKVSESTILQSAVVGPADLVFLGAFFLAMFKFKMKPKETLKLMVPVLIGYMALVKGIDLALPALVPIGIVTLWVNRKEFNMNKEEKTSTIVLAVLLVAGLAFAFSQKRARQAGPLPLAAAQESQISEASPAPAVANQPQ